MSRGLGHVQRAVLGALNEPCNGEDWLTVAQLAGYVAGPSLTRADVEATRRAVRQLCRAGLVTVEYWDSAVTVQRARVDRGDGYAYRPRHMSSRPVMLVHAALSVEEKAARRKSIQVSSDRLVQVDAAIDRRWTA